jgi:hypothetical protein
MLATTTASTSSSPTATSLGYGTQPWRPPDTLAGPRHLRSLEPPARHPLAQAGERQGRFCRGPGNAAGKPQPFLELLADREIVPDSHLPETGVPLEWERILSAVFVRSENYGTRASTLLTRRGDGLDTFLERSFDARRNAARRGLRELSVLADIDRRVRRHEVEQLDDVGVAHADAADRSRADPSAPYPGCRGCRRNGAWYRPGRAGCGPARSRTARGFASGSSRARESARPVLASRPRRSAGGR